MDTRRRIHDYRSIWQDRLYRLRSNVSRFIHYAHTRHYWAALNSIVYILAASLLFGRLPKLPVAVLLSIPFIYLSVFGSALTLLDMVRSRYMEVPRNRFARRLIGNDTPLARLFREGAEKFLRSAFAVGVYLLAGIVWLCVGPTNSDQGWLLLPAPLLGMAAIYSMGQVPHRAVEAGGTRRFLRQALPRRFGYMLLLAGSVFCSYYFILRPFRYALWH